MSNHRWKFFRAGGVDRVALASAHDLINLEAAKSVAIIVTNSVTITNVTLSATNAPGN